MSPVDRALLVAISVSVLVVEVTCLLDPYNKHSDHECYQQHPVFSYLLGQPKVSPISGRLGLTALDIAWNVDQLAFAGDCADAFEVEFQRVGGGRLSWSAWSAMVGCAPTREDPGQKEFSCLRKLVPEDCSTRIRFRLLPHNSR